MTEEQKNCPYCRTDAKCLGDFIIHRNFYDNSYELVAMAECRPSKINYCFMCGRKLSLKDEMEVEDDE
jgi:hypothetical protein|nr:MAG TPA: zinc-ribbon containing domain protein [Caudoviricetes sp.]